MGSATKIARAIFYVGAIGVVIALAAFGTKHEVVAQPNGTNVPPSGTLQLIQVPARDGAAQAQAPMPRLDQPLLVRDPAALQQAKKAASDRAAASQRGLSPVTSSAASLQPLGVYNGTNFPGISASNGSPSDSTGAVGPTHYVEMVNSAIGVRLRGGGSMTAMALAAFGAKNTTDCTGDPQISWDQQAGRWLYSFYDQIPAASSCATIATYYLAFGWSKTSDPSDLVNGWCRFSINTSPYFFDYDKLGHDNNFISIGANVFNGTTFQTAVIVAIPKPAPGDTSCAAPASATFFGSPAAPLLNADGTSAFTPVPADTADSSAAGYIVAAHDPAIAPANKVMVWHLSSNAGTPVLTADGDVTVASYGVPPPVPQPATGSASCSTSGNCLDSLDTRLTQAVAHFDPDAGVETIWTQHAVADAAVGPRSVERWYELIPGLSSPRQEGNVSDTSLYIFNGAISPGSAGNEAVIFYNAGNASAGGFASMRVQSRNSATPLGVVSNETIIASSTVNDNDPSCGVNRNPAIGIPCRWGDYSAARPDPLDANAVWGTSMLTGTGGTSTTFGWATQVAAYTHGCASVTASAAPASPQLSGTAVTFTASASGCTSPSPLYQFWMLAPGSSWAIVQAYSSTATYNWNTAGKAAGIYLYTVWVRDASSTGNTCNSSGCLDAYSPGAPYTLTVQPCTAVTASAAPGSPQLPGTAVTFTASASGCPKPSYQFWMAAPGSSWTIVQPYSSTATYNWNTTGLAAGNYYYYAVWVRDASSVASQDANFPGTTYTLTSTACTSVTTSAAPASPQLAGTPVTFTAVASGCPNPRYQFWMAAPGGSWTIVQPYSGTATYNWNTNGLAAGNYYYTVWVKDASSAASYDAYFPGTTYTLTTTACTSVTASAAPASPQASGTAVTFTASASGCPNPRYQFWMAAPGGSWTIVQPYSPTATYNWNTTGRVAGTYYYTVWVRDATSAARYDTYVAAATYNLTTTPCTSVTDSAAPASPQAKGTTITFTAVAAGCAHPLYQFWIAASGGSWTIVQAYSTSNTFIWNTTGLAAGSYYYTVWVKDSGSSASQDAYFPGTAYTLT